MLCITVYEMSTVTDIYVRFYIIHTRYVQDKFVIFLYDMYKVSTR